jgi:two-component sensor histidine kinase
VRLLPRAALALSMGLHELATNAAKYGALLCETGTVTVHWSMHDGHLRLVWLEQGGPPMLSPGELPVGRGFGTRLIERSVARDLGGTAVISFEPQGVACVIEAPLESIASSAQVLRLLNVGNAGAR